MNLEYKIKWNDRETIKIDTICAGSQFCFVCGYKKTERKELSIREWLCPVCSAKQQRIY